MAISVGQRGMAKYLLDGADFYTRPAVRIWATLNPMPGHTNAAHLLPQLIPAQLATAQIFTDGIRSRANELRDGLLFDPRLVAYIEVLKKTKSAWEARRQKQEVDSATPAAGTPAASTKLDATTTANIGFDPGTTYSPPHLAVVSSSGKKLSDVAACLIWVNNDCEIAALDEKYLHLSGTIDPQTHAWHVKDRSKLDELLQSAENGARLGITVAENAEVDTSVLDLIFERASQLRLQNDDASGLDALRNYWRCALLGNMCWQLAHTHKAEPVDLAGAGGKDKPKPEKGAEKEEEAKSESAKDETSKTETAQTNDDSSKDKQGSGADSTPPQNSPTAAEVVQKSDEHSAPSATTPASADKVVPPGGSPPIVPAVETNAPPRALPVTDDEVSPVSRPQPDPPVKMPPVPVLSTNAAPTAVAPPVATGPVVMPDANNIPVAPIARAQDITGTGNSTNSPPANRSTSAPSNPGSSGNDQF